MYAECSTVLWILKICTIDCSVISVESLLFSPAISRPVVIFGPSFSCSAISCLVISCLAISCPAILMVRHFHVLHFQSTPRVAGGFDSRPVHRQATTLGKLLTPMCLCHQAVQFGTGQMAVMLCDREGNRRSGVALAMRHRL